ncbi:MAG: branched-chain amino acid ABC transporter permease [Spirochaetales bacterium]|nr:branched-chain amino acid ABC transporter permease [Spirochaetales bacterium]
MIDVILNTIVSGILIGGFYAACAIGLSISFGMLRIPNIAHPGFIIAGGFLTYYFNKTFGLDPLLAGLLIIPIFFAFGFLLYRGYNRFFESKRDEREGQMSALVLFFGVLMIIEALLSVTFGVDFRTVTTPWSSIVLHFGSVGICLRMAVPFLCSVLMVCILYLYFSKTYLGLVIQAVAQDSMAATLIGSDPRFAKSIAFGISFSTAAYAGTLFVCLVPVEPSLGMQFLGRVFSIAILGGLGSPLGTAVAGLIVGITESLTTAYIGSSWTLAVSFILLLIIIAVKPTGLFRR